MFCRDPGGSDGESAAHAFGPGNSVGFKPGRDRIEPIEMSGSAGTALDFVEKKEEIFFFGKPLKAQQKLLSGDINSTFTLDGFDEEGCCLIRDGGLSRFELIELGIAESGQ